MYVCMYVCMYIYIYIHIRQNGPKTDWARFEMFMKLILLQVSAEKKPDRSKRTASLGNKMQQTECPATWRMAATRLHKTNALRSCDLRAVKPHASGAGRVSRCWALAKPILSLIFLERFSWCLVSFSGIIIRSRWSAFLCPLKHRFSLDIDFFST